MAKKKLNRGTRNTLKRKYSQGGSAYALPTSAAATTNNMMGMGDPAQLQKNLQMANAMATEQSQRIKAQEDMRIKAAGQASKDNFESSYTRSQQQIASTFPGMGTTAVNTARVGMGTANAAQVAQASGDSTAALLGNLGNYGNQTSGQAARAGLKAGLKSAGPNALASVGGTGLNLAGAGVKHLANDKDATTMNVGETAGTLMQGAGTGLGLAGTLGLMGAVPGIGWAAAGIGALGYGIHGLVQRNKARVEQDRVDEQNAIARQNMSIAQQQAFDKNFIKQGSDIGYNVGNSMSNSYTPNQQMMYSKTGGDIGDPHKRMLKKQNRQTRKAQRAYERASKKANRKGISPYKEGGEMIKRADGSYSQRGLWDNIRANKGSDKEPTKEMLEQEKKIKAQEKKMGGQSVPGGVIKPIGNGAVEFVGRKHSEGCIMIDPQTEVEGGETMDKVAMSQGNKSDYIFSEFLKLGGKSFAKRHKEILKRGGSPAQVQSEIQRLAKMQEDVAKRKGESDRTPEKIMKTGGYTKYQLAGFLSNQEASPDYTDIGLSPDNIYYPQLGYGWAQQGNSPKIDFTSVEVGRPGSASAMQGSPFQTGYGLPADMTDEQLEDFYTNTHIPGITRSFNENRDQVIANAKAASEFADVNKQNFDLKIRNDDG